MAPKATRSAAAKAKGKAKAKATTTSSEAVASASTATWKAASVNAHVHVVCGGQHPPPHTSTPTLDTNSSPTTPSHTHASWWNRSGARVAELYLAHLLFRCPLLQQAAVVLSASSLTPAHPKDDLQMEKASTSTAPLLRALARPSGGSSELQDTAGHPSAALVEEEQREREVLRAIRAVLCGALELPATFDGCEAAQQELWMRAFAFLPPPALRPTTTTSAALHLSEKEEREDEGDTCDAAHTAGVPEGGEFHEMQTTLPVVPVLEPNSRSTFAWQQHDDVASGQTQMMEGIRGEEPFDQASHAAEEEAAEKPAHDHNSIGALSPAEWLLRAQYWNPLFQSYPYTRQVSFSAVEQHLRRQPATPRSAADEPAEHSTLYFDVIVATDLDTFHSVLSYYTHTAQLTTTAAGETSKAATSAAASARKRGRHTTERSCVVHRSFTLSREPVLVLCPMLCSLTGNTTRELADRARQRASKPSLHHEDRTPSPPSLQTAEEEEEGDRETVQCAYGVQLLLECLFLVSHKTPSVKGGSESAVSSPQTAQHFFNPLWRDAVAEAVEHCSAITGVEFALALV